MLVSGVIHAHCTFSVKGSPVPELSKSAFNVFREFSSVKEYLIHLDKVARNEVDEAKMSKEQKKEVERNKEKFTEFCRIEGARKEIIEYATLHLGISCVHPVLDPKQWRPPYGQVG